MKSIIILGTVLFATFSSVGIFAYVKTKQNHSLDKLYQTNEILIQKKVTEAQPETEEINSENYIYGNKQKSEIQLEDFSRGEKEFTPIRKK